MLTGINITVYRVLRHCFTSVTSLNPSKKPERPELRLSSLTDVETEFSASDLLGGTLGSPGPQEEECGGFAEPPPYSMPALAETGFRGWESREVSAITQ